MIHLPRKISTVDHQAGIENLSEVINSLKPHPVFSSFPKQQGRPLVLIENRAIAIFTVGRSGYFLPNK